MHNTFKNKIIINLLIIIFFNQHPVLIDVPKYQHSILAFAVLVVYLL